MTDVYEKHSIPANIQRVLLCLCDFADDAGTCYPSVPRIAWKLECSTRTVQRAIDDLERLGALSVYRRQGRSSWYAIHLDALPPKEPFKPKGETQAQIIARMAAEQRALDVVSVADVRGDNMTGVPPTKCHPNPRQNVTHNRHRTVTEPSPFSSSADDAASAPSKKRTKSIKAFPWQQVYDDPQFAAFWAAYPRSDGKRPAAFSWYQMNPNADLVAQIMAALKWQVHRSEWRDADKIPHAATWLNNARWEDEKPNAGAATVYGTDELAAQRARQGAQPVAFIPFELPDVAPSRRVTHSGTGNE